MNIIPLKAVPFQVFDIVLGTQSCSIEVFERNAGVFVDLYMNGQPVVLSSLARDRVKLVRAPYGGFVGDIAFLDTEGANDPTYKGFGTRYQLVYIP